MFKLVIYLLSYESQKVDQKEKNCPALVYVPTSEEFCLNNVQQVRTKKNKYNNTFSVFV